MIKELAEQIKAKAKHDGEEVLLWLFALLIVAVYVVLAVAWHAYALSVVWGWFAVPIFGLPELTVPQAAGVGWMCSMLVRPYRSGDSDGDLKKAIVNSTLGPLVYIATAAIIRAFM